MKPLLKAFRNFFLIFAIMVIAAIVLSNSDKARNFVTPTAISSDSNTDSNEEPLQGKP